MISDLGAVLADQASSATGVQRDQVAYLCENLGAELIDSVQNSTGRFDIFLRIELRGGISKCCGNGTDGAFRLLSI